MKKYLTFDDVLLLPNYSEVLPTQTSLKTVLSDSITLEIPVISAAMDTVTEHNMAISMALNGALGIIHKNLTISQQAQEVKLVKEFNLLTSKNPICCDVSLDVEEIQDTIQSYNISSIIITDQQKPIGILTKKDLKFLIEKNQDLATFLADKSLITCNTSSQLADVRDLMFEHQITKIVVVNESNELVSIVTMSDLDNFDKYTHRSVDQDNNLLVGAAISTSDDALARVEALVDAGVDILVIDSAHANSKGVITLVSKIRSLYPTLDIIAGNVVTKDAVTNLAKAGANIIKIGIGSGSICTTRIVSGVGAPQLTALFECKKAALEAGVKIISDGGTRYSGDIIKALAAGADGVMLGSMLAGHAQSPGDLIISNGKRFKSYMGMGSIAAMNKGSGDRYFQTKTKKFVPEGVEALIEYKGDVDETLYQIKGGLKSAMGYNGAPNLEELVKNAQFIEMTSSGMAESHPHSLDQFQSSPNYK